MLAQGITETNIAFLILVMLYSEVRRQERKVRAYMICSARRVGVDPHVQKRNHAAGGGSGIVG